MLSDRPRTKNEMQNISIIYYQWIEWGRNKMFSNCDFSTTEGGKSVTRIFDSLLWLISYESYTISYLSFLIEGFKFLRFYFNIVFYYLKYRWSRWSPRVTWRGTRWWWIWRIYLNNSWTRSRTVWGWWDIRDVTDAIWTWGDASGTIACWVDSRILRFYHRVYKLLRTTQQMVKVWIWFQFAKCLTPIKCFYFMVYFA